ncbi:MAG: response regulator transcription factor [Emticicia sp.]|nr:response regulator transcription factor [Emticicia sp.]
MKTKILYAEDEPFLGKIVKESLESRSFEVIMVTDGKDGLVAYGQHKPDICVLDVMLPNKDGFKLAAEIRQLNPAIPIIFLTAKTQTEDLVKGFQSGGNDYIRKPFSIEELIIRINNLLNLTLQKNTNATSVIVIGEYEVFLNKYVLTRQGKIKKISYREAELIKILSENQNSIISRKDILMQIWGDDSYFNSRNLDVYMTKLREYFKDDPSLEIMTIKGVGYFFRV